MEETLVAKLNKDRVEISKQSYDELSRSGYGQEEGDVYYLMLYEAMYLLSIGKIKVTNEKGEEVSFKELAIIAQEKDINSWTKFIVYRDLRARGYVVREGFGFGSDLRLYEKGDYMQKPAKYVVFTLDEGTDMDVKTLGEYVNGIKKSGKEALVAVLERRGEVIYYKISPTFS